MQFEVRFTNGYWKLFDNKAYREVAMFDSYKEAKQAQSRRTVTRSR